MDHQNIHMQLMNELNVRNLIMTTRQEIEEEELPFNRLKRCIQNGLHTIVITILHSNAFSKDELYDALNIVAFHNQKNPRSLAVNKIMYNAILDEIHILDNNNECVLK